MEAPIGCAVIGYGPLHNFGWAHAAWISATPELRLVAVCDLDSARTEAACRDFPGIRTYNDVTDVWADPDVQLVSLVTPHFTHCPLALEALAAGKHVVVEKAMCLSVAEATKMIEAAREADRMLAVHHNRRHDGNYRRIKELVEGGAIGEVFHIELAAGGYYEPQNGWYREKSKSGGGFYFWGPHAVDWVLHLVPSAIVGVNGYFHKLVWHEMTNEDQTRALIRFANGCVADVTWSTVAAVGKPLWRILGTRGGILDYGVNANPFYERQIRGPSGGSLLLVTCEGHARSEEWVPYRDCDWPTYWQGIADHLLRGAPVPVSGEFGRRVIGVLEAAERSSQTGQTESVPYE
ncbi:MAG: Gfo/Idh/MocA family oxidoreductase [Armatimonadetes bacterium]|nr:Gfo/Idh/MocA family oxidoreductase [Armatimonadota bacterium]